VDSAWDAWHVLYTDIYQLVFPDNCLLTDVNINLCWLEEGRKSELVWTVLFKLGSKECNSASSVWHFWINQLDATFNCWRMWTLICGHLHRASSLRRCPVPGTRHVTSRIPRGLSWCLPAQHRPEIPCASDVVDLQCGSWISKNTKNDCVIMCCHGSVKPAETWQCKGMLT